MSLFSIFIGLIILTVFLIILIKSIKYALTIYNELTRKLIRVNEIAGNLEAVLKKKFDMIPALIEIINSYAKHESSTFTEVARLRSQWGEAKSIKDKVKAENQLESLLSKLLIIQERYPKLKANENFQSMQDDINSMEAQILEERRYYNRIVRIYNIEVKSFPSNIIARLFRFTEGEFYSIKSQKDDNQS